MYTVRGNVRSGGPYTLREYGPPTDPTPYTREHGPSKKMYNKRIQSGGGGGLNFPDRIEVDFD